MLLETSKQFTDFELLDTGSGYRLERWGEVVLQRPDPQIIWPKSLSDEEWGKSWAVFKSGTEEEKGNWEIKKQMPYPWIVKFLSNLSPTLSSPNFAKATSDRSKGEGVTATKFLLKLSPFKHTGLFAEQAAQWEWMNNKLSSSSSYNVLKSGNTNRLKIFPPKADPPLAENKILKILNLFAYTGGATMMLAKAGCFVTHVDASKPAITWANENQELNKLPKESVRWILDDVVKFVKRELKRGEQYDGVIMDPPAFGHSPSGKTWKFNRDLPELLKGCVQLLSAQAKFLIVNSYATNSSALALNNVLEDAIRAKSGNMEFGELCLEQKSGRKISTGIFARWFA